MAPGYSIRIVRGMPATSRANNERNQPPADPFPPARDIALGNRDILAWRRFWLYKDPVFAAPSLQQKGWLKANYGISVFLPIMRPETEGGGGARRKEGRL